LVVAALLVVFAVLVALVAMSAVPGDLTGGNAAVSGGSTSPSTPPRPTTHADVSRCPWLETALDRNEAPATLAAAVLRRMTVREKLGEIVLVRSGHYENLNAGVPRLCIPALSLQDGPQGVAFGAVNVTQLPAPLGIAATFDTGVARAYGQVEGSEADGQGIDVIQGPNLNIDRVPQNGRGYEGFGEDPALVSAMGVADAEGIQSTGTMAMAKHFAVYSQETDRGDLDDVVSERALQELYLPPFEAAVRQAHVSSVMCAYPQLNGTFQCQDGALLSQLDQWGFTGFVRSDLGSVHDPVAAIDAGTDLIKPASVARLKLLVDEHRLSLSAVDTAVTRVLTTMFAHGLVGRQVTGSPGAPVDTDAHTDFALTAAERSAVLLKNAGQLLPLDPSSHRSVAVIGADGFTDPETTGYGSSRVVAPFISSPLRAIENMAGPHTAVTYSDGGNTTGNLPAVPTALLTPASGVGHGLTLTLTQTDDDVGPLSMQTVQPTVNVSLSPHPSSRRLLPGSAASTAPVDRLHSPLSSAGTSPSLGRGRIRNHTHTVLPPGWTDVSAAWTGTLTPPRSGLYTLSLQGVGAASLTLDGVTAVSDTLSHGLGRWSQSMALTAGHHYRLRLDWEPIDHLTPSGESSVTPSSLTLGWEFDSGQIAAAAAAAARASVAVVFAGDFNAEAFDRPSLSLPGDTDALISAVASANPDTVVVLNTGGPVLMPWLGQVRGVIEAWYPGEEDGDSIAALLYGGVDPSGRLPVTFPATAAGSAIDTEAQWPGVDLTATYSEGLEVGYRYDHATGVQPLFPFGFGLSYTRFSLSDLTLTRSRNGFALEVRVTNTGPRPGTDVPQAYLTFPAAAGEPPGQLEAFAPVTLSPGHSRSVTLSVPTSALRVYLGGGWTTVPGTYTFSVGSSSADLPLTTSIITP
jgi:beta-glucosidase